MSADLEMAIEALQNIILPLRQGEFSAGIGKVSVYAQSVAKSLDSSLAAMQSLEQKRTLDRDIDPKEYGKARDSIKTGFQKSLQNSIGFARRNLDAVQVQALEALVSRPRNLTRTDEQKKSVALQKTFDRLTSPQEAMLEHFQSSSDPLNKFLVAGPWGHQYLQKRKIDLEEYDRLLCETLGCQDTLAGRIVLGYAGICRAIEEVEAQACLALQ